MRPSFSTLICVKTGNRDAADDGGLPCGYAADRAIERSLPRAKRLFQTGVVQQLVLPLRHWTVSDSDQPQAVGTDSAHP